jgi:hypothetical protein
MFVAVLRIRIRMFLGLLDPDLLVRYTDPAPDPSTSCKKSKKMLWFLLFYDFLRLFMFLCRILRTLFPISKSLANLPIKLQITIYFWSSKSWIRFPIRIDKKCWIRMRIRIRIETNADPQHCLYVTRIRKDEHSLFRYRNRLFCAGLIVGQIKMSYFLFADICKIPHSPSSLWKLPSFTFLYLCWNIFVYFAKKADNVLHIFQFSIIRHHAGVKM